MIILYDQYNKLSCYILYLLKFGIRIISYHGSENYNIFIIKEKLKNMQESCISLQLKDRCSTQPSQKISKTMHNKSERRYTDQQLILPSIKTNKHRSLNSKRQLNLNNPKKSVINRIFANDERKKSLQSNKTQKQQLYNPYRKYYQEIIQLSNNSLLSNEEKALLLIYKIQPINQFFKKIYEEMATMLFRIGKIIIVNQKQAIYQKQTPIKYLYIIILGKVKLYNANQKFYTYCINGQSLGQETLFIHEYDSLKKNNNKIDCLHRQTAVCHTDVILLKISIKKLLKLGIELNSINLKHHYKQLESIFRMNFIKKTQKLKAKSD